jgi:N-acetylmuramoyl-L-alanine amidase
MKRIKFILIIALLLFPFGMNIFSQSGSTVKTVVIDAGHGGRDPGAVGKNSYEKNINLSIALKLGKYIEKNLPDVRVVYTRKTDVLIPLHRRSKIANDNQADLFISIHCNSNTSSKIYGTETYVMGLHKSQDNLKVAQLENSSILKEDDHADYYEGFNPNSTEAYIIFSLYQNASLDHSLDLASKVQKQFKDRVGLRDRGVMQAGFLVLYRATMPGILVESGYISNAKDEKYLLSNDGQNYIASAIFRAIKDYKSEQGTRTNTITQKTIKTRQASSEKSGKIIFRVQFLSSKSKINLKSKRFRDLKNLMEYEQSGMYKYCTGESSGFDKMNKLKSKLNRGKYKDAFVVAFEDGHRISVGNARKQIEK